MKAPALTAPMVFAALVVLGHSLMKEPDSLRLLMDPHRDGPGVRVEIELPPGVTVSWVLQRREAFAAALRRELGTIWLSGGRHPGHLILFVSDEPMAEAEQAPWPLRHAGEVDLFEPTPLFTDQSGAWVNLTLAYTSWIVGAVPRMGKTFVLRELGLVAGLDRRAKVIVLDGKGTGDFAPLARFAYRYVRGARTDRPENIQKVLDIVRWLLAEMGRRADIIDGLSEAECPESKVTSELVNARPDLDLGPVVVIIDETQSYYGYGSKSSKEHKEIRLEIVDGITEVAKLGPALGFIIEQASQQVRDSTIPTDIANNAVVRFAMKLEGHEPNDRILGSGSYRAGIDATQLDFADKGIGILKAEGMRAAYVRSVFGLDAPAAREIAERARRMRIADGRLIGDAAGEDDLVDAEIVIDIVADVEQVLRSHQRGRAQHVELIAWLRDLRADNYADLAVEELSARLRGAGIPIRQVRIDGVNRKGVRLSDLGQPTDGEAGGDPDASDA